MRCFDIQSGFGIWLQDDDNALLQQALAMSMEDPASSHDVRDTEMSDAAIDPELALGKVLCFNLTILGL